MTRRTFIEMVRRMIYGGQPSDDATITVNLVNKWLDQAIAVAAKMNYTESLKLDGIAYVNNSFYTTYKSLPVVSDEQFLWKVVLPQIPIGVGENLGAETLVFKDSDSRQLSYPVVWLTQKQRGFQKGMRDIPNKVLAYMEGGNVYVMTTIRLSQYTAQVTMISGGDSTDLDSKLNVPDDYHSVMIEYLKQQLMFQRTVPQDNINDGVDTIKSV